MIPIRYASSMRAALAAIIVLLASHARAEPDGNVSVTLTTNETLERQEHGDWIRVCVGPCSEIVLAGTFRLSGANVVPTDPFKLVLPGDYRVRGKMAYRSSRSAGIGLMIAGGVLTVLGSSLALWGAFNLQLSGDNIACVSSPCPSPPNGAPALAAGLILDSFALVLSPLGVTLFALPSRALVTF